MSSFYVNHSVMDTAAVDVAAAKTSHQGMLGDYQSGHVPLTGSWQSSSGANETYHTSLIKHVDLSDNLAEVGYGGSSRGLLDANQIYSNADQQAASMVVW